MPSIDIMCTPAPFVTTDVEKTGGPVQSATVEFHEPVETLCRAVWHVYFRLPRSGTMTIVARCWAHPTDKRERGENAVIDALWAVHGDVDVAVSITSKVATHRFTARPMARQVDVCENVYTFTWRVRDHATDVLG